MVWVWHGKSSNEHVTKNVVEKKYNIAAITLSIVKPTVAEHGSDDYLVPVGDRQTVPAEDLLSGHDYA